MKAVISAPKTGKSYQMEVDEKKRKALYGSKIDDKIDGGVIGLKGYKLQVRGGTDKEGFPMRKDVHGTERKRILISTGAGFKNKRKGERKRKSVRGNTISEFIEQVNFKVVKEGEKSLDEIIGKKEEKKGE